MAYMGYRGQCVGRVMAFLYQASTLSDSWGIGFNSKTGEGEIHGRGGYDTKTSKPIGYFRWEGYSDIPVFYNWDASHQFMHERLGQAYARVLAYDAHIGKIPWDFAREEKKKDIDKENFAKILQHHLLAKFAQPFKVSEKGDVYQQFGSDQDGIRQTIFARLDEPVAKFVADTLNMIFFNQKEGCISNLIEQVKLALSNEGLYASEVSDRTKAIDALSQALHSVVEALPNKGSTNEQAK